MTQPTKPAPQRTVSTAGILLAGGLAVLAATVLSVGVGSTSISPLEVVRSLLAACGLMDMGLWSCRSIPRWWPSGCPGCCADCWRAWACPCPGR